MKKSNAEIKKRRNKLIDLLKKNKEMDVHSLSTLLHVSEVTIRRDCSVLEKMGKVNKEYGKVLYVDTHSTETGDQLDYIKNEIAKKASTFVEEGDTLFINTSSTAVCVLNYLKEKSINLLTNNINAVSVEHNPKSTIILSGGEIRYPKKALSGDIAIDSFSSVRSDISIIGCSGLNIETGISTSVIHEAKINKKIVENSAKLLIVVADYRKIGISSNFTIGDILDIGLLITDSYADPNYIDKLERLGVQVIQVPI